MGQDSRVVDFQIKELISLGLQPDFDHVVRVSARRNGPEIASNIGNGRGVGKVEQLVDIVCAVVVQHAAAVFAQALPVVAAHVTRQTTGG